MINIFFKFEIHGIDFFSSMNRHEDVLTKR